MFVSDNGSPFPLAKANTYLASTWTPFLVQWPAGDINNGTIETEHMVSTVDLMPTILDAAGIEIPENVDGRSIIPILRGEKQEDRDHIFAQIDYKIGGPATPMRAVQCKDYGYIFNPFSGFSEFRVGYDRNTINMMMESGDKEQVERAKFFRNRVLEEFYDMKNDPDNMNNLIDNPEYQDIIAQHRAELEAWMESTNDPVLEIFHERENPRKVRRMMNSHYPKREDLMSEQQKEIIRARQEAQRANC